MSAPQSDSADLRRAAIEEALRRRLAVDDAAAPHGPLAPLAAVALLCVACRATSSADALFCIHCGAKFNAIVVTMPGASAAGATQP